MFPVPAAVITRVPMLRIRVRIEMALSHLTCPL
jgi:hypothetical protein